MSRPLPPARHKPFSWLPAVLEGNSDAEFIAESMDAWRGVETCLGIVASSELDRAHNMWADPGDEEVPLLSGVDSERLMRLAIITARAWDIKCEKYLQRLEARASQNPSTDNAPADGGLE